MSPHTDLAALVAAAASEAPAKLAVVEAGGRGVTWAELDEQVSRVASGLVARGVVAGHRVLLSLGHPIEFVAAYFGVLRAQAVAVPVNPRSTVDELARMLADSGARVAFGEDRTLGPLRDAIGAVGAALAGGPAGALNGAEGSDLDAEVLARAVPTHLIAVGSPALAGETAYDDLVAEAPRRLPTVPDPERLAVLLYTSGTSGRPRAAMLSHRALLANIEQVAAIDPPMIHGDDAVLGVLPLFHVYGLNGVLGGAVRRRAKLVLQERFEPHETLDLIEDEACSVLALAPAVFPQWLALDDLEEHLGPVRLVVSGSAPLAPDLVVRFTGRTGIAVHQGYGLTEAAPVVTSTLCSRTIQPGSVGAPLEGVDLRLVDERGTVLTDDDPGEIQVRGANLFSGYWPDRADGPDPDGWWSTGDVGFLDRAGDLHLVDRVKELVLVSGFNVYPHEVEAVIAEVPGVREAAVIGVPDPATGETVVAYVVASGVAADALAEAVREHCAQRLAGFKRPTRVEVVEHLPLSVTGKVQKGRLRGLERRRALELLDE